eukprot:1344175-Amphidinium_carterae.1
MHKVRRHPWNKRSKFRGVSCVAASLKVNHHHLIVGEEVWGSRERVVRMRVPMDIQLKTKTITNNLPVFRFK